MNSHIGRRTCRGGALIKFLVFLAVVFALLALAWMLFLPAMLGSTLSKRTGFTATIKELKANPFTGKVNLVGCTVINPPEWPTPDFVEIREFRATADILSFFSSRIIVDDAVIDVARVSVVTDARGRTNVQSFKERVAGLAGKKKDPKKEPEPEAPKAFLIRHLHLRFDKVMLADYSKKSPSIREVNINLDKSYENVTSASQVVTGAVPGIEAVGLAIESLIPGDLGKAISGATKGTTELIKKTGQKATEAVKGLIEKLEEKPKP